MTIPPLFRPVIHVDSVSSTMALLGTLVQHGAHPGTTVVADLQTEGRGRSGRTWTTPSGTALLMSTLLRPPRPLGACGPLALLAGLAVARAIEAHIDATCEIKWPNDVLIEGRKVAGILISGREGSMSGALPGSSTVIVGIGVNVTTESEDLPRDATSVQRYARCPIDRTDVLGGIDVALARVYADFRVDAVEAAFGDVNERLVFRDQEVIVQDGPRQRRGRLRGVDRDGGLVLVSEAGSIIIRSGELTRGPRRVST